MATTWTKDDVFEFLSEEPRIGRLATVTPQGDPHVVPVWFRTEGDHILVHTMGESGKARNLRHLGRFALTVDTDRWPCKGVTVRGGARLAGSDEIDHAPFIEDLTVGYLGEQGRPLGRYMADLEGEHLILLLEPETWHAFDYSAN